MMSGMNDNSSPFALEALDIHMVVDSIISHLGDNPLDLLPYRSVCHEWNNIIVKKINKSGISVQIPLQYGPEVPKGIRIAQSDAQKWTKDVMQSVMNTLTGTADKIHFDTVAVSRDFYLAGVQLEWEQFLEIHGESIRHLKFKIRRGKSPGSLENYVSDCEAIVSMENLRAVFCSTPNLESLDFCIRFSHYGSRANGSFRQRMLLGCKIPRLQKLTKVTIQEPHRFPYIHAFLKEILSMAPHLKSLYIKPTRQTSQTFCRAIKSMENQLKGSLTSFGISSAESLGSGLPYLRLTTLEINSISGIGEPGMVNAFLQAQQFSLVTVILGNRRKMRDEGPNYLNLILNILIPELSFPVMENLKSLEVNLNQFKLARVNSYRIQFPALECLTLSVRGGNQNMESPFAIMKVLDPQDRRPSGTLKELWVFGRQPGLRRMDIISASARVTFPTAVHHIGELVSV